LFNLQILNFWSKQVKNETYRPIENGGKRVNFIEMGTEVGMKVGRNEEKD
jgi:hypothetical protein